MNDNFLSFAHGFRSIKSVLYFNMVVLCVVCTEHKKRFFYVLWLCVRLFIHSINVIHSFIHVATSRAGCVFCCGIFSLHFFGSINYNLNISPRAHSSDWNSAISVSCADVQVR